MPDLSALVGSLTLFRSYALVFTRLGPKAYPDAQLANSFVRLTEHALAEYTAARERLGAFRNTRDIGDILFAVNHLETGVVATHRAMTFAEALRRKGLKHQDDEPLVPRSLEPLRDQVRDRVRDLRDAIQHADERLTNGSARDHYYLLSPDATGVVLGADRLAYVEWARWLRRLHELAVRLNSYEEKT